MDQDYLNRLFQYLEPHCQLHEGLHDDEFETIETTYGFQFPPDLMPEDYGTLLTAGELHAIVVYLSSQEPKP